MWRKNRAWLIGCLAAIVAVSSLAAGCVSGTGPAPAATPTPTAPKATSAPAAGAPPKPGAIRLGTFPVGRATYMWAAAIATRAEETTGVVWRVVPRSFMARLQDLRANVIDLGCGVGSGIYAVQGPIAEFVSADWGPQDLRLVWCGGVQLQCMVTQADSGITSAADFKGKTVAWCESHGSAKFPIDIGVYAYYGYTDFAEKPGTFKYLNLTASDGTQELVAGTLQLHIVNPTAAVSYEMSAGPHGLRWIGVPPEDTAGWARLREWMPAERPFLLKQGEAPGVPKEGVWAVAHNSPLFTYASLDEAKAYWITKGIGDSQEAWKDMHPDLKYLTKEFALDPGIWDLPYHEGSIKYFKEIGAWKPEHEAAQAKMLKELKDNIASWKYTGQKGTWKKQAR